MFEMDEAMLVRFGFGVLRMDEAIGVEMLRVEAMLVRFGFGVEMLRMCEAVLETTDVLVKFRFGGEGVLTVRIFRRFGDGVGGGWMRLVGVSLVGVVGICV
eukprot:GHVO01051292.1.p2 GENE.GHVO01051292.1~~GHVO01051292.1.p2  ORF type:complete len:101 (+),score=11.75 GHVO01051292.1:328-630(+)